MVHSAIMGEGVELMPLRQALKVHDWLKDYVWKAVQPDTDKYTAETYLQKADGYFIRALPGAKVKMPVQTCLLLKNRNTKQYVHNVLIAEEGSEFEVVTGCATTKGVEKGLHLGISEFFLKKNSKLTFTMIHNWSEFIGVRPRTSVHHGRRGDVHQQLRGLEAGQDHPDVSDGAHERAERRMPLQFRGRGPPGQRAGPGLQGRY